MASKRVLCDRSLALLDDVSRIAAWAAKLGGQTENPANAVKKPRLGLPRDLTGSELGEKRSRLVWNVHSVW